AEPPSKRAGPQRRIGSDHLQEPPAAERRNGVVRTEVGMLPTRGRAHLGAFRQGGDRDLEIRSAPEQMVAGGRQGPIYTQRRARRQRVMRAEPWTPLREPGLCPTPAHSCPSPASASTPPSAVRRASSASPARPPSSEPPSRPLSRAATS